MKHHRIEELSEARKLLLEAVPDAEGSERLRKKLLNPVLAVRCAPQYAVWNQHAANFGERSAEIGNVVQHHVREN